MRLGEVPCLVREVGVSATVIAAERVIVIETSAVAVSGVPLVESVTVHRNTAVRLSPEASPVALKVELAEVGLVAVMVPPETFAQE